MQIAELPINPRAVTWNRRVEAVLMVAEEPLSRIVLTGGSALVPALRQALVARSRLPVTVLEPFARVQIDARVELAALRANAPAAAVAFGLALRTEDDAP